MITPTRAYGEIVGGKQVAVKEFFAALPEAKFNMALLDPARDPRGFKAAIDEFGGTLAADDRTKVNELLTRCILLKECGLESPYRLALSDLGYHVYWCTKGKPADIEPHLDADIGTKLTDGQQATIFTRFPAVHQWGFDERYGDLVADHIEEYGRGEVSENPWTIDIGGKEYEYHTICWPRYNFDIIPLNVLKQIHALQRNPLVHQLDIMAPKEAIEKAVQDPVLVAHGPKIGRRLVARWSEALNPIPGLDT